MTSNKPIALAPLLAIPLEILQDIVRQLDPISLVALSQTSTSWRAVISPLRHDYIQRLLALELVPAHGGIVPVFDEHNMDLAPPWDSDEWKATKYACCGCMKLRRHMMFTNHAILHRPYRKPPPESVEAAKAAITDWEPLAPAARWRRIQERAASEQAVRRECARAADARRLDAQQHAPAHPFARISLRHAETDRETAKYLVGVARQKRRCIDCERRHRNWPMLTTAPPSAANKTIPAVRSRQLRFHGLWERYFPGLLERPPPAKFPRPWRALRGSSDDTLLTLYLVSCPGCDTWQEHSAFRQWDLFRWGFHSPRPTSLPLLCNRCHLETHKDPDLLARELSAGALKILRSCQQEALSHLEFGWKWVRRDFHGSERDPNNAVLGEYAAVGHELLDGLQWNSDRDVVVERSNMPDLRRRLDRYKQFLYHEIRPETRSRVLQSWTKLWVEDYALTEGMYYWLSKNIECVESDPAIVLKHVLEHDPYRV
jgi:hypothetical protein